MQTCLRITPKVNVRRFFRSSQSAALHCDRYQGFSRTLTSDLHRRVQLFRSRNARSQAPKLLPQVQYPVVGSDRIESVSYTADSDSEEGSVWINQTQYFCGISPKVWNCSFGKQQPCQKWLQEREQLTLCDDSIQRYQRIVTLLADVVELMEQVDDVLHQT